MNRRSGKSLILFIALSLSTTGCYSAYFYEGRYCNETNPYLEKTGNFSLRLRDPKRVILTKETIPELKERARITFEIDDASECGFGSGGPCFLPFIPYPIIGISERRIVIKSEGHRLRFTNLTLTRGKKRIPVEISRTKSEININYIKIPKSIFRKSLSISAEKMLLETEGAWTDLGPLRFQLRPYRAVVLRFFNDFENGTNHVQWIVDNTSAYRIKN